MSFPNNPLKVVIVGRPNVGKSTLFNRIIGRRQAIVDDWEGVTRDRQYGTTEWNGRGFMLVDTGGYDPMGERLAKAVAEQIRAALAEASLVLFVVDGKIGLTNRELEFAKVLRKTGKPILLVVNKIDHEGLETQMQEFFKLGFDQVYPVAAESGRGIGDLLDALVLKLPEQANQAQTAADIKIALIGRPNVGKSTLLNQMIGEERAVVFDEPGTTRDPLSIFLESGSRLYELVDTAGIRRRKQTEGKVEKVSVLKALGMIEKSHVILILVDATKPIESQDLKVMNYAYKQGRGMAILLNKWDLASKAKLAVLEKEFHDTYETLDFVPMLAISAKTGLNVNKIFPMVEKIFTNMNRRIPTGQLNKFFEAIIETHPHPTKSGLTINLKYMTQVAVRPPQFIVFCNHPNKILTSYIRFLENRLREAWDFTGAPLRINFQKS
ncbi:MAG: ribosome biogenesis GTPase Der [Deltaproteobacteria bacterium]|nr:ribosome biogenesis GTPase Der [Deltaproteobacteria bacterium]